MRKPALIATAVATAAVLAACSSGGSTPASSASGSVDTSPVTLTLWHNYGTEQNAVATTKLTEAYHAAHPNVTCGGCRGAVGLALIRSGTWCSR